MPTSKERVEEIRTKLKRLASMTKLEGWEQASADLLTAHDEMEARWRTAVEVVNEYRERAWKAEDALNARTIQKGDAE